MDKKRTQNGKQRILFVEYFSFIGGAQVVMINLINKLRKDYDIKVLVLNEGPLMKMLKDNKIEYDFIEAPQTVKYRHFISMMRFVRKFMKYLDEHEVELIFSNCFFATKLTAIAAKIKKVPVLWHKHITVDKKYFSYMAGQMRFYSKFVSKMICVSDAVKETVRKTGVSKKKLVTVYNGIEMPDEKAKRSRNSIRTKHKLKSSDFLVGSVGFLRPNKGFGILIKAAAVVKQINPKIKFMIVGKGEDCDINYEDDLKSAVKKSKLTGTVIFAGYQEKFSYMSAFDLYCLPSFNEPFGMVTIEASAMGLPIVAFDTGGTSEIITDNVNGFLVQKPDHNLLAVKIIEIYNKKEKLDKVKKTAIKNVKDRFTIEKQIKQIVEIIEESV